MLGCSGSMPGPESPASGYLIAGAGDERLLMDIGPGVLGAMQRTEGVEPSECHVVLSHMHADHCLDFPSLLVWRRFHPTHPARSVHHLIGPSIAQVHLAAASGDSPEDPDDFTDTFAVREHRCGSGPFDPDAWPVHKIGELSVFSAPATHTTEAYIVRVHDGAGRSVVYSGDTSPTPRLVEIAEGADVLLCEAAWGPSSEGKPEGMHMSGADAGRAARQAGVGKLIVTHIPPWGDAQATLAAAQAEFDGSAELAYPGMRVSI